MSDLSNLSGQLLTEAMTEVPSLVLSFYSFGLILQKRDGDRLCEYPVDPAQVALALAAKVHFDTGLLSGNTLLVRQNGVQKLIVDYRPPQKTGLYLDGSEAVLRVPLPGLILIRTTTEDQRPQYQLYAVKQRPTGLTCPVYHAPLPNVYGNGHICWGTVPQVSEAAFGRVSLADDWAVLLGSRFNDHGVGGKSQRHPGDIRQLWIDLEARQARMYPKSDLIPVKRTLAHILGDA